MQREYPSDITALQRAYPYVKFYTPRTRRQLPWKLHMHYVEIDRPYQEWIAQFFEFAKEYEVFPEYVYIKFVEVHANRTCLYWGYTIKDVDLSFSAKPELLFDRRAVSA